MQISAESPSLAAKLSFEEIAAFFKVKRHLKEEGGLISNFYHWSEHSAIKVNSNRGFYVCDNSRAWNLVNYPGLYLHEVSVLIKNPLILLDQWCTLEEMDFWRTGVLTKKDLLSTKRTRHAHIDENTDSIIVTMHPMHDEPYLRQMLLLDPKEAVLSSELIWKVSNT